MHDAAWWQDVQRPIYTFGRSAVFTLAFCFLPLESPTRLPNCSDADQTAFSRGPAVQKA